MKLPLPRIITRLEAKPFRSQIFVAITALCSILCLIAACLFLWHEKTGFWLPASGCVIFLIISIWAFNKSYRSSELDEATPFSLVSNGINLSVDSKLIADPLSFNRLLQLINGAGELPAPQGLVTNSGEIIPNSEIDAIKMTNMANSSIKDIVKENIVRFKSGEIDTHDEMYFREPPIPPSQEVKFTDIADRR
ncbi:hypothetical protein [Serratia marcescens]|uniref:hypothetical protein n=1 Tax=Serratia marcescens TaxID=615 RepID=UPI0018D9A850|nr:hypothetical protein [Serratia marcescens]MBK5605405.1 hypothetical protein [Serratia marcescens]